MKLVPGAINITNQVIVAGSLLLSLSLFIAPVVLLESIALLSTYVGKRLYSCTLWRINDMIQTSLLIQMTALHLLLCLLNGSAVTALKCSWH